MLSENERALCLELVMAWRIMQFVYPAKMEELQVEAGVYEMLEQYAKEGDPRCGAEFGRSEDGRLTVNGHIIHIRK